MRRAENVPAAPLASGVRGENVELRDVEDA
jgi:hypothetical protein